MSWCRNGGRDVYEKPDTTVYEHVRQYRGFAHFTDAEPIPIAFSTEARKGQVRHLSHFEVDGVEYWPR